MIVEIIQGYMSSQDEIIALRISYVLGFSKNYMEKYFPKEGKWQFLRINVFGRSSYVTKAPPVDVIFIILGG